MNAEEGIFLRKKRVNLSPFQRGELKREFS
jgi:hypothetical protein